MRRVCTVCCMRIGIVQSAPWHPEKDPGSLETLLTSFASSAAQEHEVVLYSPLYDPMYEQSSVVEDWSLRSEQFTRLSVPAARLADVVASGGHDLVSVHNLPGAAVRVAGPVALFLHGRPKPETGWPGRIPGYASPLDLSWDSTLRELARAARLATPSRYAAASLAAFSADVDVVYPIVHPAYLAVERDDASHRVAWIGRPVRSKGLPFLVEHGPRWRFEWSWSASGFYGDLDRGMLDAIPNRLAPCRSRAEMAAFYASTKVVLCPYRNEGFGMVATEAAAAGCRVVGFADGGLLETAVVPHIHLVEPDDAESFNLAVLAALDAGPVSAEDRNKVWEAFSPASSGAAYLAHLRRAASSGG